MFQSLKSTLFLFAIVASTAHAEDFVWQRYWTGCNWAYQKVAVQQQKVENTTTIVNNLIGIPIPVQYTQPVAAQGTTVYGYQSISDNYSQLDMGLLYNQAARLTDQAQQLAGQAATDFQTLVHSEGQYRAQVAQTLAQGQIVKEALLAAKPQSQTATVQRSFTFRVVPEPDGQIKIESIKADQDNQAIVESTKHHDFNLINPRMQSVEPSADQLMNATSTLLTKKCIACHNAEKSLGGLNFLGPITDAQQKKVLARVTTDDLSKRMPRKPDGTVDDKLSVNDLSLLFKTMNVTTQSK